MSVQATYVFQIDYDGDGSFATPGDTVTDDLMRATIDRGFVTPLARMPYIGRATFTMKNLDKAYSPPLDAKLLPGRAVRFQMTYDGSTVTLFQGFIESIRPAPLTWGPRNTIIECVDFMAPLDIFEGRIGIKTNARADDVIFDVVNDVDSGIVTNYQRGINVFATSGEQWSLDSIIGTGFKAAREDVVASTKILDACTADWGRFFIDKQGRPTFYNRHQMPLDTVTALTLDNTMQRMSYEKRLSEVYNWISVTYLPRTVSERPEVLGRLTPGRAAEIGPLQSETFIIRFRDPVNQAINIGGLQTLEPVANTDYAATSDEAGEGSDATGDLSIIMTAYADRAEVTVTNTSAATVWLQRLQVRGYAVRSREPEMVHATDATSIAKYGRRKLHINATLMSNNAQAAALANYLLDVYKEPFDIVTDLSIFGNDSDEFMAAIRDLELMDKVVVSEDQTGLSGFTGHIYRMRHEIELNHSHWLTFSLETPYDVGGTPFRLDTSQLNSGHILIY